MATPIYVDIHAHVLPGIDDGPRDLDGALALGRAAFAAGTKVLVATPHLRADFPLVHVQELAGRCLALCEALRAEGIGLQVVCGAEVSLLWALEASDRELALATYGQQGTDLLVEAPSTPVIGLESLLSQLDARGPRIILAHPERYPPFQGDLALLVELVEQGVVLQVNADSLLGSERTSLSCRLGRHLVRDGLAHVLASDGHRAQRWRPVTRLAEAVEAAETIVGPRRAEWMAAVAPAAIIAGALLPPAPPACDRIPIAPRGSGRGRRRLAVRRGSQ